MRILQVNTADAEGGAAGFARQLFEAYRLLGHDSWLAVGVKRSRDADVFVIPKARPTNLWSRLCRNSAASLKQRFGTLRGTDRAGRMLDGLASPRRWFETQLGREDFSFPETWRLLDLAPQKPDVVHCHNLHGGYFDLRVLPWLSQQAPVVLTLHDAWLLSGHCAHSFGCERWKTGCGQCPDLTIAPPIRRDATGFNAQRKRNLYAQSRLYVGTPCRWLMSKVEQSMLAAGVVETRVIPHGVDLSVFRPAADRNAARAVLGLPQDATILLFAGHGIRHNPWRDYETMQTVVALVAEHAPPQPLLFVALGEDAPPERLGRAEVRFVRFLEDPRTVAGYYQAADIYLHAARADTFPTTVLEALACGTPVVATAVGGIPEQVKDMTAASDGADEPTGLLVPPGDAAGMATGITRLLTDPALRHNLGSNAAKDAARRFDARNHATTYLAWYQSIVEEFASLGGQWSNRPLTCAARA